MQSPQTETTLSLYAIPGFGGSAPVPDVVEKVDDLWDRAEASAESGEWLTAATMFASAAVQLRLPADAPYGEVAHKARGLAYLNAAVCWRRAGAQVLGTKRLNEARVADAASIEQIDAALAALNAP